MAVNGWQDKGLGWVPDLPDQRDYHFTPILLRTVPPDAKLPHMANLRARMPGIYDQGQVGSCCGNALAAAIEYDLRKQRLPEFVPSRLMAYYNARFLEGATGADAGASIRDVVKGAVTWGICSESPQADPTTVWPYVQSEVLIRPNRNCYEEAKKTLIQNYARVAQTEPGVRSALAAGYPVIFGATLYENFMSDDVARTGHVPMPAANERAVGGHALLITGYDDARRVFTVRNSWGRGWGLPSAPGYCEFPYDYVLSPDLADDLWVVNTVT